MTQVLLNRGLGSVGVGVSSATVKGVRDLPFSTLKAAGKVLNPFKRGQARAHDGAGVPLRVHEHHERGRLLPARGSATPCRRPRACSPTSRSRTCTATRRRRSTSPRKAGSPSVHRVQRGSRRAPEGHTPQRAEVRRLGLDHRVPGVRGSSHSRELRGGGGRRLRDRLGGAPRRAVGGRSRHCS